MKRLFRCAAPGLLWLALLPACFDIKTVSVDAGTPQKGTGGGVATDGGAGGNGGAGGMQGGAGGAPPTPGSGGIIIAGAGGMTGGGGMLGTGGEMAVGGMTGAGGGAGGTGGTAGTPGSGGAPGTAGAGGTGDCGALIDDMEAGTGYICQGNGRVGHWFTYIDNSPASSITPAASSTNVATPYTVSPARGSSQRAMRAFGEYFSYGGIACLLNNATLGQTPKTFDALASGYTGIRFYARGLGGMTVVMNTSATIASSFGGTCTLATCIGAMYSVPSTMIAVDAWNLITVPFSALAAGTSAFRASDLWSIGFQPNLVGAFDIWIDDLTFY